MISLIDGDGLVYEAGFSSDSEAKKSGLEYEPLSCAIQNLDEKLRDILDICSADDYEMFLTGKGNFRYEILPEYKANRDSSHRPYWYSELRNYLIEEHEAIVSENEEADDLLGIHQSDNTIICSKDKDLDCVPGMHYNWSPKRKDDGVYILTELDSLRFFWTQVLTGDPSDNVPGLFRLTGRKASSKIKQGLEGLTTNRQMFEYVRDLYGDIDFTPMAKCLWIKRGPDDMWEVPNESLQSIHSNQEELLSEPNV